MCKVTQFFNSKKVGGDAVDDGFFLLHYIWNIPKMVAMARLFHLRFRCSLKNVVIL